MEASRTKSLTKYKKSCIYIFFFFQEKDTWSYQIIYQSLKKSLANSVKTINLTI
uniref:Uncharacterized protein n=1 Tax=Anguilla anguilla TaxID=7936 RepID=A0A0E9X136_ANGAN